MIPPGFSYVGTIRPSAPCDMASVKLADPRRPVLRTIKTVFHDGLAIEVSAPSLSEARRLYRLAYLHLAPQTRQRAGLRRKSS